jgi:RNA polymerase sigma-70 factor (ECF subfamily)
MSLETDANLALRIHRGETQAITDMVIRHQHALFSYAIRFLSDPEEARDVAQESLINAYRTLTERYDTERCKQVELKPYLFRIVRNLALNRMRKTRREKEAIQTAVRLDIPGESVSRWDATWIERALNGLSRDEREIITLRFFEGMSYAGMADVMDQSEAALRGRVFRVLKKLRVIMEEE